MLKDRLKRKAKQKVKQEAKKQAKQQVQKAARKEGAPKLLKTAAAGGAGYYAGEKIAEKRPEDQMAGDQAYPPPSAPDPGSDTVAQLQQLAQMHDSGALTDEEFASAKQRLLAGG
jgi:hypothetical protein